MRNAKLKYKLEKIRDKCLKGDCEYDAAQSKAVQLIMDAIDALVPVSTGINNEIIEIKIIDCSNHTTLCSGEYDVIKNLIMRGESEDFSLNGSKHICLQFFTSYDDDEDTRIQFMAEVTITDEGHVEIGINGNVRLAVWWTIAPIQNIQELIPNLNTWSEVKDVILMVASILDPKIDYIIPQTSIAENN